MPCVAGGFCRRKSLLQTSKPAQGKIFLWLFSEKLVKKWINVEPVRMFSTAFLIGEVIT